MPCRGRYHRRFGSEMARTPVAVAIRRRIRDFQLIGRPLLEGDILVVIPAQAGIQ